MSTISDINSKFVLSCFWLLYHGFNIFRLAAASHQHTAVSFRRMQHSGNCRNQDDQRRQTRTAWHGTTTSLSYAMTATPAKQPLLPTSRNNGGLWLSSMSFSLSSWFSFILSVAVLEGAIRNLTRNISEALFRSLWNVASTKLKH